MGDTDRELHADTPLLLLEAEDGGSGPFNPDGTVNVVIIRPGRARGRAGAGGRRLYPAQMLQESAEMFTGWPVFDNHESPAAKKARGNFPRPTSDLRGEIRESHWDPDFTHPDDAKWGHEKGAVAGRLMPTPDMRALIEAVPNSIRLSVNAFARSLRTGRYGNDSVEIVEGFDGDAGGSVDAVTKAGAGGRVLALLESDYDREHGTPERTLAEVEDDDLVHHLREHRPHLLEALDDEGDGGVKDGDGTGGTPTQQPLTVRELLESEEFKTAVDAAADAKVAAALQESHTLQESESSTRTARSLELRDLRDDARRTIEDSRLPGVFQDDLRERYALREADDGTLVPTASLDVVAERDADGAVVKPARKVLQEALASDIERERLKLQETSVTRVRGQGASGAGRDGGTSATSTTARRGGFADGLRKAGVPVPTKQEAKA